MQATKELLLIQLADAEIVQIGGIIFKEAGFVHGAAQHDHAVNDRRRYAKLFAEVVVNFAAHRDVLGGVAVIDGIWPRIALVTWFAPRKDHIILALGAEAHVLLRQHAAAGEEGLVGIVRNTASPAKIF